MRKTGLWVWRQCHLFPVTVCWVLLSILQASDPACTGFCCNFRLWRTVHMFSSTGMQWALLAFLTSESQWTTKIQQTITYSSWTVLCRNLFLDSIDSIVVVNGVYVWCASRQVLIGLPVSLLHTVIKVCDLTPEFFGKLNTWGLSRLCCRLL